MAAGMGGGTTTSGFATCGSCSFDFTLYCLVSWRAVARAWFEVVVGFNIVICIPLERLLASVRELRAAAEFRVFFLRIFESIINDIYLCKIN
jgi:hypothetical protein